MEIQLIDGQYTSADALELLTQIIHVKIKFHENKISGKSTEEDVKARERRIKQLQKDLFELRNYISSKRGGAIALRSTVVIK